MSQLMSNYGEILPPLEPEYMDIKPYIPTKADIERWKRELKKPIKVNKLNLLENIE